MIVTTQNFIGKYALSQSMYNTPDYGFYIDTYEDQLIDQLLGAELAELFRADLVLGGGVPTEQRFIDIFMPFSIDYNYSIKRSEGIEIMLTGFIYFEIVRDQENKMTPVGNVASKAENSDAVRSYNSTMWDRYNRAVRTHKAIQSFIHKNSNDYPEFNGKDKKFSYWI